MCVLVNLALGYPALSPHDVRGPAQPGSARFPGGAFPGVPCRGESFPPEAAVRIFQKCDGRVTVRPDTLLHRLRKGFRLFWSWKSKPTGRPRLPRDLRDLIRKMVETRDLGLAPHRPEIPQ